MSLFNFRTSKLVLACAALVVGGSLVGASGCGGIDTSSLAGFCEAQAVAECSFPIVQACYGSNDASVETDTNNCIATRSRLDKCNPKNLPYHPEFADNCINTRANIYAKGSFEKAEADSIREACLPVFNKGGAEGTECTDDLDCNVGAELRCVVRLGGRGVCRVPTLVEGGSSCADPQIQCGDKFFCDSGLHCVERGRTGEACGAGQPCASGFRCNEAKQACEPQFANGSTCKLDSDCTGGFCLGIQLAGAQEGQCSATYQFGFGGPACVAFTK